MKLELSDNLKRLRRERKLSQEQLGDQLGVTSQSISHWECGVAYPDMEFLPVIAGFFGVTTDELLGVSGVFAQERKRRYWREHDSLTDISKRIALFKQAFAEFPNEWRFALHLCYDMQSDPEYLDEIRRIVYDALDKCTDQELRSHFIIMFSEVESDERIGGFLEKYTIEHDLSFGQMLEQRYFKRGEHDKLLIMEQKNAVKRMEAILSDVIDSTVKEKDPVATVGRIRANLDFLNTYLGIDEVSKQQHPVSGDGTPDLWFEVRVKNGVRLSCRLAALGKTEEALYVLEDLTELYEKFFTMPAGTCIGYRLDTLGLLNATAMPYALNNEVFDGQEYDVINTIEIHYLDRTGEKSEDDDVDKRFFADQCFGDILVYNKEKQWFNPIREHPRFISCMERMRKVAFERLK